MVCKNHVGIAAIMRRKAYSGCNRCLGDYIMNKRYKKSCGIGFLLVLALVLSNLEIKRMIRDKIGDSQFLVWCTTVSAQKIDFAQVIDYRKASGPDNYTLSFDEEKQLAELLNQVDEKSCRLNKDTHLGPMKFTLYVSGNGKSYLFKSYGENPDILYIIPETVTEISEYSVGNLKQLSITSRELADFVMSKIRRNHICVMKRMGEFSRGDL